jgi:D-3-phosphoglycerate dehydrogenase
MRFRVVVTMTIPQHHFDNSYEEEVLGELGADVIKYERCATEEALIAACHDADGIINVFEPFSRRVIEKLSNCKIISKVGIGLDGTDIDAATEHGIVLTNVPDYCVEEVSDHAMALLLACSRKLFRMNEVVVKGGLNWWIRKARDPLVPMLALREQTLGLVGFGKIAHSLVPKAKSFGLKIMAYDPWLAHGEIERNGVTPVSFDRLLQKSDFVSIHVPVKKDTYHMFGEAQFRNMKPTAYLINTARGGVVDEQALHTAVSRHWIAGAGLDVMEEEPPSPNNPLLHLNNVIITPHNASYSETAYWKLRREPVDEVARVLQRLKRVSSRSGNG